ncbi:MAG: YchF/TatD family DNA exonuclease [Pantoea sp. Brub]|nr:YchF/TatD family DNA exonuclease [Pantoea sp. Brub]
MFIVDSHCHLDMLDYNTCHHNVDDVIEKAKRKDVRFLLAVSTTLTSFHTLKKLIDKHKNVALSCGVHPLYQSVTYELEELNSLAQDPKVIAIGETGLDYHYKQHDKIQQNKSFRNHIRTAIALNKPLIVHTRHAIQDTINILNEEKANLCRGIVHCFSEDEKTASKLLDMGFYISFSGMITFRNIDKFHKVIKYIPIDRILIETDSPYLSPVPFRDKENQPAYTRDIAAYLAILKNIDLEQLATETTNNFSELFQINMNLLIN